MQELDVPSKSRDSLEQPSKEDYTIDELDMGSIVRFDDPPDYLLNSTSSRVSRATLLQQVNK